MITVMLIDDELLALEELKYHLSQYPAVHIIGMYTAPRDAITAIKDQKPDLVFLDIDMPFINGMEAALKIQEISINTEIVFVTAHHQFSLQAFELHALDYILKPIADDRFKKTMTRVISRCSTNASHINRSESLFIQCFGKFNIIKKGKQKNDVLKWRTAKAKELFLYLLYRHDKTITKNELIYSLFGDFDEKKAQNNLYVTMFYLRKCLEEFGIREISIKDSYNIDVSPGMCDYIDFMRLLDSDPDIFVDDKIKECEIILEKYKGLFLEEEDYLWAIEIREYCDRKFEELSLSAANHYIADSKVKKAITTLLRLLKRNPYSEEGNRKLLNIYMSQKNDEEYKKFYPEYEKILREEFDLEPERKYSEYFARISPNGPRKIL